MSSGDLILWLVWLPGVYLFWKFAKNFRPSLPFYGWGRLRSEFAIGAADLPPTLALVHAGLRVGSYHTDMARIGVDDIHLYLKRPFGSAIDGMLRIPLRRLKLVSAPQARGPILGLPVAGVFKVNGVDLWIGSPIAERIIARLTPAPAL